MNYITGLLTVLFLLLFVCCCFGVFVSVCFVVCVLFGGVLFFIPRMFIAYHVFFKVFILKFNIIFILIYFICSFFILLIGCFGVFSF